MTEIHPGEIDFGSSYREVRVSEGSSYRESTVSYPILLVMHKKIIMILKFNSQRFKRFLLQAKLQLSS